MKKYLKLFALVSFLVLPYLSFSQGNEQQQQKDNFLGDFTYDKNSIKERKPIPYPPLREADVIYARRIHRIMDSREKMNLITKWPKNPLNCIIYKAVTEGIDGVRLTAYVNDSLVSFYTPEEVLQRGATQEVVPVYPYPEEDPEYYYDSIITNEFRCSDIIRYRIMEDWIFDKQSGMFFPRIIAIAPLYKPTAEGVELGEQALFWVDYKQLRKILVNEQVFNRHNDAMRMTYYDFFEQRMFSSYIVKEPNEYDFDINMFEEYKNDAFQALLQSEKIKEELFNWEHDLWQY